MNNHTNEDDYYNHTDNVSDVMLWTILGAVTILLILFIILEICRKYNYIR
jgi:hypothetical protein